MTYAGTAAWLRPRLWLGWAAGVVVWVSWVVSLALGTWTRDIEGTPLGSDHVAFYVAARMIRDGRQADIYDYGKVSEEDQRVLGEGVGTTVYRNPPFYALLYLPTAGLPFVASTLIWMGVGLAAFAFAVWLLRPARPWRVVAWSACFYPFFAAVCFGQNTLLSLAVFAAVYRLTADRRPFAAGLVAGLLWFKPQLLIGLFVWWALTPRRSLLCWAGVAVTGAVLAAVSWLALPEASWAFVETLRTNMGYSAEASWNKHTPRVFFERLLPGYSNLAWGLAAACAAAGVAVAVWVARRTGAPVAVMFPVAVFLSLWASPHALVYEWALLIPAAVVLWERFPDRGDAWLCLFAPAWAALAVGTPVAMWQERHLHWPVIVQVSIPVLGVVGWLAARELRGARPPRDQRRARADHGVRLERGAGRRGGADTGRRT